MAVEHVHDKLFEAGRCMTSGAVRAAEEALDDASRTDGITIVAGVTRVMDATIAEISRNRNMLTSYAVTMQLATSLLGRTVLRDWSSLWSALKAGGDNGAQIRSLVESALTQHALLWIQREAQGVLSNLSDVWAVLVKLRISDAEVGDDPTAVVAELSATRATLEALLLSTEADPAVCSVSRTVVIRTIEECGLFSLRSQRRGLPAATHDAAREAFQQHVLPFLWERAVEAWLRCVDPTAVATPSPATMTLLQVIHALLHWRFRRLVTSTGFELGQEDGAPAVLCVVKGAVWKSALRRTAPGDHHVTIVTSLASLVVDAAAASQVLASSRQTSVIVGPFAVANEQALAELRAVASECVVQISSMTGSDDDGWSDADRAAHAMSVAQTIIPAAFQVLPNAAREETQGAALLTFCSAIERIVSSIGTTDALFHHPELNAFHEHLNLLTREVIAQHLRFSQNYDSDASEEEQRLSEALDKLLRTWTMILNTAFGDASVRCRLDSSGASGVLADCALDVFRTYVTGKVSAQINGPSNNAAAAAHYSATLGDTTGGAKEHATEFALNHMQAVGQLGRERPDAASAFLLEALSFVGVHLTNAMATGVTLVPPNICEALWYLLRLTGEFIADDDERERPCIPGPICMYSVRVERELSMSGSLDDTLPSEVRAARFEAANKVFGLMNTVLQLAESLADEMHDKGPERSAIPPSVVESMVFLLHRFAASYIAVDADNQTDFAESLTVAFDEGRRAAAVTLRFVSTSLLTFSHEPSCVSECISTIQALVDKIPLSTWMISRPEMTTFLAIAVGGVPFRLPPEATGALVGLLCSVASQASTASDTEQSSAMATAGILHYVLPSHPVSLVDVLRQPLQSTGALLDVSAVASVALIIRGALKYLRNPSVVSEIVEELIPVIGELCAVITETRTPAYADHLPLLTAVVDLLDTAIDSCSSFLPMRIMDVLMNHVSGVVHASATRLRGAFTKFESVGVSHTRGLSVRAEVDEDERIALLQSTLRLLLNVATWSTCDLSNMWDSENDSTSSSAVPQGEPSWRLEIISLAVVDGLLALLDVVGQASSLLQLPALSDAVYHLLREVADSNVNALVTRPSPEQWELVVVFITSAFDSANVERTKCAFNIIQSLAKHAAKTRDRDDGLIPRLRWFLDALWQLFAGGSVESSLISALAWAVYSIAALIGPEEVYRSWQQAFSTCQQHIDPRSSTGQLIDRTLLSALQHTDFSSERTNSMHAFANELGAAQAVLRGALVTL